MSRNPNFKSAKAWNTIINTKSSSRTFGGKRKPNAIDIAGAKLVGLSVIKNSLILEVVVPKFLPSPNQAAGQVLEDGRKFAMAMYKKEKKKDQTANSQAAPDANGSSSAAPASVSAASTSTQSVIDKTAANSKIADSTPHILEADVPFAVSIYVEKEQSKKDSILQVYEKVKDDLPVEANIIGLSGTVEYEAGKEGRKIYINADDVQIIEAKRTPREKFHTFVNSRRHINWVPITSEILSIPAIIQFYKKENKIPATFTYEPGCKIPWPEEIVKHLQKYYEKKTTTDNTSPDTAIRAFFWKRYCQSAAEKTLYGQQNVLIKTSPLSEREKRLIYRCVEITDEMTEEDVARYPLIFEETKDGKVIRYGVVEGIDQQLLPFSENSFFYEKGTEKKKMPCFFFFAAIEKFFAEEDGTVSAKTCLAHVKLWSDKALRLLALLPDEVSSSPYDSIMQYYGDKMDLTIRAVPDVEGTMFNDPDPKLSMNFDFRVNFFAGAGVSVFHNLGQFVRKEGIRVNAATVVKLLTKHGKTPHDMMGEIINMSDPRNKPTTIPKNYDISDIEAQGVFNVENSSITINSNDNSTFAFYILIPKNSPDFHVDEQDMFENKGITDEEQKIGYWSEVFEEKRRDVKKSDVSVMLSSLIEPPKYDGQSKFRNYIIYAVNLALNDEFSTVPESVDVSLPPVGIWTKAAHQDTTSTVETSVPVNLSDKGKQPMDITEDDSKKNEEKEQTETTVTEQTQSKPTEDESEDEHTTHESDHESSVSKKRQRENDEEEKDDGEKEPKKKKQKKHDKHGKRDKRDKHSKD